MLYFIKMELHWLGHSCFRIKGSRTTVITDPYSPNLGYSLGKLVANIVTVSHQHPGHANIAGIDGAPKIVCGPGEYEIAGVLIIGMPTYHDQVEGKERGKNTIYVMDVDEVTICHLGDLGHALTAGQVEEIGKVDVLLLPVGGVSTIDATAASKIVRQLEPRVVVPMHYKTEVLPWELEPVDKFLKEMGVKEVIPQSKLSLTRSSLPSNMQVSLLNY
jgi:L-ascorbate metabolism protein UlaG (beta-lactamase superfamily)